MNKVEVFVANVARKAGLEISRVSSRSRRLPVEATTRDAEAIESLQEYTMTSSERLWSLIESVRYVIQEGIPGDFVECGVWRGGSVMAMLNELRKMEAMDRRVWLYDTFAGMTPPSSADVEASTGRHANELLSATPKDTGNNVWCIADVQDVTRNVTTTGYPLDLIKFIEGDVAKTLLDSAPDTIALLRLDTDWYESTRKSLEVLYPRLAVGGVCILDDYGHWQGARKAVDEYFAALGHRPLMHPIDYSGRIFLKPASHA